MVVCISKNILIVQPLYFPEINLIVIAYENIVEVIESELNIIWKLEGQSKVAYLESYGDLQSKFYVSYDNGDIKLCDIETKTVELKMELNNSVKKVFFINDGDIIAVEADTINLYYQGDINRKVEISKNSFQQIAMGKKTGIIGMIQNRTVMVTHIYDKKYFLYTLPKMKKRFCLTTIACHPTRPIIATGETTGCIRIWWDVNTKLRQNTIYHWHHLSLRALEFNFNGTELLSGGREQVLVRWALTQTEDKKKRSYLPRLDANIESIKSINSREGEVYLVVLEDNSLRVISSCLRETKFSYSGLIQRSSFLHNKVWKDCPMNPIGIRSCCKLPAEFDGCVMMNGHEGKLQFYDLNRRITRQHLDVTLQNWPTESENHLIPGFRQVKFVTVSSCGQFIATIERRGWRLTLNDDHQCFMKIFKWNNDTHEFELESELIMDQWYRITGIVFHPISSNFLVVATIKMELLLYVKINTDNVAYWTLGNVLPLEEILHRFQIKVDMSDEYVPTNLVVAENEVYNGLLMVTRLDCVVLYQWADIIKFNTKPLFATTLDTLIEDVDMESENKNILRSSILSSAIFRQREKRRCYRIVLALSNGLIVVEVTIRHNFVKYFIDLKTISSAISNCGVRCLSAFPGSTGENSKVAIIFEKSDHITIYSVWDDSESNTQVIPVPPLEDVTWVPVNDKAEWSLIGLLKDNQNRSIVICEDKDEKYFNEHEIRKVKLEDKNPLNLCEDSVRVAKKRKRPITSCLYDGYFLYDPKTAPTAKVLFNATYSKAFIP